MGSLDDVITIDSSPRSSPELEAPPPKRARIEPPPPIAEDQTPSMPQTKSFGKSLPSQSAMFETVRRQVPLQVPPRMSLSNGSPQPEDRRNPSAAPESAQKGVMIGWKKIELFSDRLELQWEKPQGEPRLVDLHIHMFIALGLVVARQVLTVLEWRGGDPWETWEEEVNASSSWKSVPLQVGNLYYIYLRLFDDQNVYRAFASTQQIKPGMKEFQP